MSIVERDLTLEANALKATINEATDEHRWEIEYQVCLWLEGEEPEETLREARETQEATQRLVNDLERLEREVRSRLVQARAAKKKACDLEENVLDISPELMGESAGTAK